MRIDAVTIFPEYFKALSLSLMGKAHESGALDLRVHDLRGWTTDRHHTVDDAPLGGGAGMVMKPDVWGTAIDAILADAADTAGDAVADGIDGSRQRVVLAIPTPSGVPYTQRVAERLAETDRIVIACGRYEGVDARVAEHYRAAPGIEVLEFSIGDYVLNGGEAAALVLVESVVRLLPGVLGNPESLAEESHGSDGLLEYPVYTRPATWRERSVPDVLLSGHHAKIARWRRDRALARTAERRPDMLLRHEGLTPADAPALARAGYLPGPHGIRTLDVREARADEVAELSALAAETFPLACPPGVPAEDLALHMERNLSPQRFAHYLDNPRYVLTVAEVDGELAGYVLAVLPGDDGGPDTLEEAAAIPVRPIAEISKIYVRERFHASGLSRVLMDDMVERLRGMTWQGIPLAGTWLGTSQLNRRAIRFYKKCGFKKVGVRHFQLGKRVENDYVFYRPYVD